MNKIVRILGLVFFTLLYSLVIGKTQPVSSASGFATPSQGEEQRYFSVSSNELVCQATESTSAICNFNNTIPPQAKAFSAILPIREQLFACSISRYIANTTHLLVSFKKTILIFPFHYFL